MKKILLPIICLFAVSCASDYPCGEPRSGRCQSMTQSYNNSLTPVTNPEDLPVNGNYASCSGGSCKSASNDPSKTLAAFSMNAKYPQAYSNGSPLISTPNMMRVWYAPYVDSDNIFHDQEYQYMIVDRGHWLFGSNTVFGKTMSEYSNTTTLIQSSNPVDQTSQPNTSNKALDTAQQGANQVNQSSTPALNMFKNLPQSDVQITNSMGLGNK